MDEYLLFADETNPSDTNPYFCFSGISISRKYYEDIFIQQINQLKKKHFGTTDVIFHFTDMKKNKKDFHKLAKTLSTKIYCVGTENESVLGLKKIL